MDKEPNAQDEAAPVNWQEFVGAWLKELKAADEEEKGWREDAQKAVDLYRGGKTGRTATSGAVFNIYHANVEVLGPALYNSTPKPDVRRRYSDGDEAGKIVSQVIERGLSFSTDQYDFDDVMQQCTQDGINCSRGIARIRYEPVITMGADGTPAKIDESVRAEYVPWKAFRRGPGRVWSDVSWIAFEHYLPKTEIEKLAPDLASRSDMPYRYSSGGIKDVDDGSPNPDAPGRRMHVWEIWDRDSRRVVFVSPDFAEQPIAVIDDPLGLVDFYPIPRPLQLLKTTGSLIPVTMLSTYEHLIRELDETSKRIIKLTKQVRVRGGIAGTTLDLKAIAEADDGELVQLTTADSALSTMAGGIEKMIAWFPIEPTVRAISELMVARDTIKQQIYEVTGIADIVRGATKATETATAQQLKAQFGSVRIQKHQGEVARFARDLFRIKAEILCEKFEPQTLVTMTGVNIDANLVGLMRSDQMRAYRIDIETDSTIRNDVVRNQEQMALFLQGTAQYLQAVGPMVQQGIVPAGEAVKLFTAFARAFKLGKQAEDTLEALGNNAEKAQIIPPQMIEAEKAKAEVALKQQQTMAEIEMKKGEIGQKLQTDAVKAGNDARALELERQKLDLERARLAMEDERWRAELNTRTRDASMKDAREREKAAANSAPPMIGPMM